MSAINVVGTIVCGSTELYLQRILIFRKIALSEQVSQVSCASPLRSQ